MNGAPLMRDRRDFHGRVPLCPDPPAFTRAGKELWQSDAVESFYGRRENEAGNADRQEDRMGHGLFDTVEPNPGRNTGWILTDTRRPLPPALNKRPNHMLNIDFASIIGPPSHTGVTHGNQVWIHEQSRRLASSNAKVNTGAGALDHFNLFGDAIATGGGGGTMVEGLPKEKTVYGYTWRGYGAGQRTRFLPTAENKRREVIDNRTRLGDKAYAKPGGMFGQEQSRLGLMQLPKNSDLYEIPWRSMLPSKSVAAGLPAAAENVVLSAQRRTGDGTVVLLGPAGVTTGERPIYRDQLHSKSDTKQILETGYAMHAGGRNSYGDWSLNEADDTRYPAKQYTQFASRPGNPGFIGGMEFIADAQQAYRTYPSGKKHTKRSEFNDWDFATRFKIPTVSYALQFNQAFPYYGDRRKIPHIEVSPDSAILEPRRRNPFAIPLNPYIGYKD